MKKGNRRKNCSWGLIVELDLESWGVRAHISEGYRNREVCDEDMPNSFNAFEMWRAITCVSPWNSKDVLQMRVIHVRRFAIDTSILWQILYCQTCIGTFFQVSHPNNFGTVWDIGSIRTANDINSRDESEKCVKKTIEKQFYQLHGPLWFGKTGKFSFRDIWQYVYLKWTAFVGNYSFRPPPV